MTFDADDARADMLAAGRNVAANFRGAVPAMDGPGLDEWATSLLALEPGPRFDQLDEASARWGVTVDLLDDCVQAGRADMAVADWWAHGG